jgi:hypothetical protein
LKEYSTHGQRQSRDVKERARDRVDRGESGKDEARGQELRMKLDKLPRGGESQREVKHGTGLRPLHWSNRASLSSGEELISRDSALDRHRVALWIYAENLKEARHRRGSAGHRGSRDSGHRVDDRTGGGSGEEGGPFGWGGAGTDEGRRGAGRRPIEEYGCEREEAGAIARAAQQA